MAGAPRTATTHCRTPGQLIVEDGRTVPQKKAEANELPKITPKRFNPSGEAWLPILHTTKQGWHFTALYSNTARAHQLGRVKDWVIITFHDDQHHEGQHTVVTETRGVDSDKRVVRGRETECRKYYSGQA